MLFYIDCWVPKGRPGIRPMYSGEYRESLERYYTLGAVTKHGFCYVVVCPD